MDSNKLEEAMHSSIRKMLIDSPALQQEAITKFILSCVTMAYELSQMCDARRLQPYPVDHLESAAKYIQDQISKAFENTFGHQLISTDQ